MAETTAAERSLEMTSTWAVAVVCFLLVAVSVFIEHLLHVLETWLKRKDRRALVEALEKIKVELMLMGFVSLLLTVSQGPISDICISESLASTWLPCGNEQKLEKENVSSDDRKRRLLPIIDVDAASRRNLAAVEDECTKKGKVAFVSAYGIHQLHIFIFVLAVSHVLYCITTYLLGRTKMRKWKLWEDETQTFEYQYRNDPDRFRFARDTSFGRRHLNLWSHGPLFIWMVCFFRQFFDSVTKADYLTLRHGFIMAHMEPGSGMRFNFQMYIQRSLEEDFKIIVGISPVIWLVALLLLLANTNGWHAYIWLPFIPLIIILLVGTKLQVIITHLGLKNQERGDVVKGTPLVQPGNELFWFGCPRLILFLIHLVLFQNAFGQAFFVWGMYEFGIKSCFHYEAEHIIIRITMGILIQVLCSYVTLPLYALVTQMGSSIRPSIFNEHTAAVLENRHHEPRKHVRRWKHSKSQVPLSPVHLLHGYQTTFAPDSWSSYYDVELCDPETSNARNGDEDEVSHGDHNARRQDALVQDSVCARHELSRQLPETRDQELKE